MSTAVEIVGRAMAGARQVIQEDRRIAEFCGELTDLGRIVRNEVHLDHQVEIGSGAPGLHHLRVSHVAVADLSSGGGGSSGLVHLMDSQGDDRALGLLDQLAKSLWRAAVDRVEKTRGLEEAFRRRAFQAVLQISMIVLIRFGGHDDGVVDLGLVRECEELLHGVVLAARTAVRERETGLVSSEYRWT